ncbi:MAG: aerial mycelium formation protein [Acidimicrobiia bacterium]|nr:aerial mycelium formation protein [Acidimicrobiia bacterium]
MSQHRRRIDQVMDPTFTESLEDLSNAEIRSRRAMLDDLDTELSYYRRMLHGRLDLLDFELRRRHGEETRSVIEALPQILTDGSAGRSSSPLDRELSLATPEYAGAGRREVDKALADNFLARLPNLDEAELTRIREGLATAEADVSTKRRAVYDAHDIITAELTRRYREGVADADELLKAP